VETVADLERERSAYSRKTLEVFARFHLLTDYVSGMTDRFALEIHRTLMGMGALRP